jgi:hypothetical protein
VQTLPDAFVTCWQRAAQTRFVPFVWARRTRRKRGVGPFTFARPANQRPPDSLLAALQFSVQPADKNSVNFLRSRSTSCWPADGLRGCLSACPLTQGGSFAIQPSPRKSWTFRYYIALWPHWLRWRCLISSRCGLLLYMTKLSGIVGQKIRLPPLNISQITSLDGDVVTLTWRFWL